MHMRFFTIPIRDPHSATEELNTFLATHRIVHTERQFVADGANSVWSICVSYLAGDAGRAASAADKRSKKVDYREVLSEPEFAVFAQLRALRKEFADREGVPVYAVFANEHLADMVRRRLRTMEGLKTIAGVGAGRIDKYGEAFLRILTKAELPPESHGVESNGDATHPHSA